MYFEFRDQRNEKALILKNLIESLSLVYLNFKTIFIHLNNKIKNHQ